MRVQKLRSMKVREILQEEKFEFLLMQHLLPSQLKLAYLADIKN